MPAGPEEGLEKSATLLIALGEDHAAEVLKLLAQGLPNKSIANALGVSEGTIKVHLIAVFRALNVRNRTAAVLAAKGHLG